LGGDRSRSYRTRLATRVAQGENKKRTLQPGSSINAKAGIETGLTNYRESRHVASK
jgi:hypothetical protein